MSSPYQGAPLPSQVNVRWYEVKSPKGHERRRGVILSESFTGFWTHWDGASLACSNDPTCERCKAGRGNRWQGYLPFWDLRLKERTVETFSEGAARLLLKLKDKYGSLRGIAIETFRKDPAKRNSAQLVVEYDGEWGDSCPSEHDILPSLLRIWGMNEAFIKHGRQPPFTVRGYVQGDGVPIPSVPVGEDLSRPTQEQRNRLKETLGGMFGMA